MARQTNAAYWAQRMKNMEDALLDQSYSYVENLEKQFAAAQAEIERHIARWYQRFAANNEIDLAEAKRLLNSKELKEFHWTVAEYIAYFKDFQALKYDHAAEYKDLAGLYSYKGRVPEASKADYKAYKAVKATGVIGTIRVPPETIDAGILTFNDAHATRHGCTLDDAKGYVRAAKCTVRRKRWDGVSINCYSLDGAAYIDADTMKVKTAFSEKDFDPTTRAIAEVFR